MELCPTCRIGCVAGKSDGDLDAVGSYVADVVGCSPDRITTVEVFGDGNRHDVYRVAYLETSNLAGEVVVRIAYGNDPARRAEAEREARVLRMVGGVAAPRLFDFRLTSQWFDRPVMCMELIPGSPQDLRSTTPAELERLGSVVRSVHRQPTDGLDDLRAADDIASYAEYRAQTILGKTSWIRDPLPESTQDQLHAATQVVARLLDVPREAAAFRTGERPALLHGDIGPGNTLWSPDPVLIDWEYARIGDPADEIAYVFDQNGLAPAQRDAFWRGYAEARDEQSVLRHLHRRVDWWERITLLGSTLWWVERWVRRNEAAAAGRLDPAVPRDQDYYADHVARRLQRFAELAH
jgi:aminoglycoside phosphotransferase (APT) family kinase protein